MITLLALLLAAAQVAEPNPLDEEDEFYPVVFRGSWAPTLADCKSEFGENVITIGRTKIWAYEADSKLLKITPVASFTGPGGKDAESINAVVAERGESEVGIGKLRLIVSGGKLYPSRIEDEVDEQRQFSSPHVRCPAN